MTTEPAPRLPKLLAVTRKPGMELSQVLLTFDDYVEAWSVFQWVRAASIHPPASAGLTSAEENTAMQTYIGTKLVRMQPMTRAEYNEFRGWTVPADENLEDEGYLVEYLVGGKPNTPHFNGYVSWSPKAHADVAYRPTTGMSFGLAIEALRKGAQVARAGWNGKGQFVYLVPAASYPVQTGAAKAHFGEGAMVPYNAYLALKGVNETVSTWVPSVTDCLADDWTIVE